MSFEKATPSEVAVEITESEESYWDTPESYYYYDDCYDCDSYNSYYDWRTYNWDDRDNPCTPSYYMLSKRSAVI